MTKFLVTGHKGFIGSRLMRLLTDSAEDVVGMDTVDYISNSSDLNRSTFNSFLSNYLPDAIFHVGANSNTLDTDVNGMFLLNYEITKWISDWALDNSKPVIYSSSAANYGAHGEYPSNLYGWSKYAAEDYVRKSGGVSLRYFNVYGPGESHKSTMASFVYQAYMRASNQGDVMLFPGKPERDFIHVDDVCEANIFALDHFSDPGISGGVFEVGSGQAHTFEEALGQFGIDWGYLPETHVPLGYQMFTQAKSKRFLPGWKPNIDFFSGMAKYRAHLEGNLDS